jgi:hypothetical protein
MSTPSRHIWQGAEVYLHFTPRLLYHWDVPQQGGFHSWTGRSGEDENFLLLQEFEPRTVQPEP